MIRVYGVYLCEESDETKDKCGLDCPVFRGGNCIPQKKMSGGENDE